MKMRLEHYNLILDAFQALAKRSPTIRQEYTDRGLSETRFLWYAFRAAQVQGGSTAWICQYLYSYLHDKTIETGLRSAANKAWPKGEQ